MTDLVLHVPDEMVPAVDEAIRATYGAIVSTEMDATAAMRAVARFWLGELMADHAARQARAAGDADVAAAETARSQAIQNAAQAARDAVAAIPWGPDGPPPAP